VAPDESAGLHFAPGDRFDTHADLAIAEGDVVEDRQGKTIARRIGRDLREHVGSNARPNRRAALGSSGRGAESDGKKGATLWSNAPTITET